MNRTGLAIAIAIGVAAGLPFGLRPQLDLEVSGLFFDPVAKAFINGQTAPGGLAWPEACREIAMWIVTALAVPGVVALMLKVIMPSVRLVMPARAVAFLVATLVVAPGLLTNVILKEHWGRPRPIDVHEFAGSDQFVAWWDPRGSCPHNCSFVAGEGSGAFWTLAPAALAPPPVRPLAYAAALAFGAAVGTLRIAFGGHFFTDVVFSGVFTFSIIWVVHGLIYRWPKPAISDLALEAAAERLVAPLHGAVARPIARLGGLIRRIGSHPRGT